MPVLPTPSIVLCNVAQCHYLPSSCFAELWHTGSSEVFFDRVHPSLRRYSSWCFATWQPLPLLVSPSVVSLMCRPSAQATVIVFPLLPCHMLLRSVAFSFWSHYLWSSLCSWFLRPTACNAKRVFATAEASVCLSVCPSVRLSVTLLYCVKTTQLRIMKSSLYDSPESLVSN